MEAMFSARNLFHTGKQGRYFSSKQAVHDIEHIEYSFSLTLGSAGILFTKSSNPPPSLTNQMVQPLSNSTVSIQYNTIQYNTIQYNTIQYNTIQYLLSAECEIRTASYGPSFFLPFMAKARSARAMKTRKEKTRIHNLLYGPSKRG